MSSSGDIHFDVLKKASDGTGLPCFCMIRNESHFLPHLLEHYRSLGVSHFIFYDDNSTDSSREILFCQQDCTVLTSKHSFQEKVKDGQPFHYHARTAVPEQFGGGWCLTVDADEFLLLPEAYPSLQHCIEDLERRGHVCVLAPMVDFFPATLSGRHYPAERAPLEGCDWWFDQDPGFERDPYNDLIKPLPRGIRVRLLDMLLARARTESRVFFQKASHIQSCGRCRCSRPAAESSEPTLTR